MSDYPSLLDQWKPTDRDGIVWERTCGGTGNWQGTREGRTPASLNISELCLEAMLRGEECTFSEDECECQTPAVRHTFGMPVDTEKLTGWQYGDHETWGPVWSCVFNGERLPCPAGKLAAILDGGGYVDRADLSRTDIRKAFGIPPKPENPLTIDGITPVETERLKDWRRVDATGWQVTAISPGCFDTCEVDRGWVADLCAGRCPMDIGEIPGEVGASEWRKAFGREPAEQPPEPIRRCDICKTEGDAVACPERHPDLREVWRMPDGSPIPRLRPWPQSGQGIAVNSWTSDCVWFEPVGPSNLSPYASCRAARQWSAGVVAAADERVMMALFEPPDVPDPPRSRHPRRPTPWDPEAT